MKMQEKLTYVKITEIIHMYCPKQNSWKQYTIPLFLFDFLIHVQYIHTLYWWLRENWKRTELWILLFSSFLLCNHFLHRWLASIISYLSCICFQPHWIHWILIHQWSTRIVWPWSIINAIYEGAGRKHAYCMYLF